MLFWNVSKYGNIYKTVFVIFCYRKYLTRIFYSLRNIIMSDDDMLFCMYDNDKDERNEIESDVCTVNESGTDTDNDDSDSSMYEFMREVSCTPTKGDSEKNKTNKKKMVTFNSKLFVVWIPERSEYGESLINELWYTAFDYRIFSQTYQMEKRLERLAMEMYW